MPQPNQWIIKEEQKMLIDWSGTRGKVQADDQK